MALRAVRSQLALVNVGVAILAPLPNISEYGLGVTFSARDRCVHTSEWILGLVVIEFRDGADRLPGIRCVAVLAGDV
jgi:hypothetical protein